MAQWQLGVQSRHLVDRVDDEPVGLRESELGDGVVGYKAAERPEPKTETMGGHELREMSAHPVMAVVVDRFDGGLPDSSTW